MAVNSLVPVLPGTHSSELCYFYFRLCTMGRGEVHLDPTLKEYFLVDFFSYETQVTNKQTKKKQIKTKQTNTQTKNKQTTQQTKKTKTKTNKQTNKQKTFPL